MRAFFSVWELYYVSFCHVSYHISVVILRVGNNHRTHYQFKLKTNSRAREKSQKKGLVCIHTYPGCLHKHDNLFKETAKQIFQFLVYLVSYLIGLK